MAEVPKSVRDGEAAANEMIRQYSQEREGTPETPAPEPEPERATAPTEPEPITPTDPSAPEPTDSWQQKYNVLKGKFDAEVPVLNQQVSYLMQQNQSLAQKVQEIEASRPEMSEPTTSELPQAIRDHEKIKSFKLEFEDIFEPTVILCRGLIQEAVGRLERKFGDRLAGVVQSKKEQFYETLDQAYPDWEKIQKSPEFGAYMREADSLSGISRWHLLKDAYDKLDAKRAIRFFDHFFGKTTANPPNPINLSSGKLGSRIAPPQSRAANPQNGNGDRMSPQKARQEYSKLSDLRARNKITDADFKKAEARLWPLMQER